MEKYIFLDATRCFLVIKSLCKHTNIGTVVYTLIRANYVAEINANFKELKEAAAQSGNDYPSPHLLILQISIMRNLPTTSMCLLHNPVLRIHHYLHQECELYYFVNNKYYV